MTDNEIKAVAFLQIAQGIKADKAEIDLVTVDTLCNLISRQKAEIEELKYENSLLCNGSVRALAQQFSKYAVDDEKTIDEVSQLKPDYTAGLIGTICKDVLIHTRTVEDYEKFKKYIKNETIKEFGKFLIDKSQYVMISPGDIPNYVKEMTEGPNDQQKT